MNELMQLLTGQQSLLDELLSLISAEKEALMTQDAAALMALAEKKSSALIALRRNDAALEQHPERAKLNEDEALREAVSHAKATLEQCKLHNAANAQLIEHSQASINRLAQALQVSRNASSLTYTDKGKTSTIASLGSSIEV